MNKKCGPILLGRHSVESEEMITLPISSVTIMACT